MSTEANEYDASRIQVLTAVEAVRKRPGMYIGSTGEQGLHHLVFEVVGRALAEASTVAVTLVENGGVRVTDDGPGMAFDELTTPCPAPPPGGRRIPLIGLPSGTGALFFANALSRRLRMESGRDGRRVARVYWRGDEICAAAPAGPTTGTGTSLTFWPDPEIFETTVCSFEVLAERLREVAFLNRDLRLSLSDEQRSERFIFP